MLLLFFVSVEDEARLVASFDTSGRLARRNGISVHLYPLFRSLLKVPTPLCPLRCSPRCPCSRTSTSMTTSPIHFAQNIRHSYSTTRGYSTSPELKVLPPTGGRYGAMRCVTCSIAVAHAIKLELGDHYIRVSVSLFSSHTDLLHILGSASYFDQTHAGFANPCFLVSEMRPSLDSLKRVSARGGSDSYQAHGLQPSD